MSEESSISDQIAGIVVDATLRDRVLTENEEQSIRELQSRCPHNSDPVAFMTAEGECDDCGAYIFTPDMLPFG